VFEIVGDITNVQVIASGRRIRRLKTRRRQAGPEDQAFPELALQRAFDAFGDAAVVTIQPASRV